MQQVMTVCGPIDPQVLGLTSIHEHVLLDCSQDKRNYETSVPKETQEKFLSGFPKDIRKNLDSPVQLENIGLNQANFALMRDNIIMDDEDWMAGELLDFKESGGSALVDASAIGLRSNIAGIKRLSQRSGVHIIATTGFYMQDFIPVQFQDCSVDMYRAFMVAELNDGIAGTDVRPGHIKIAVLDLTDSQIRRLQAGTRAAMETGTSISVHPGTGVGNDGRRIARILIREGLEPERILINHSDGFMVEHDLKKLVLNPTCWSLNLDYHHELLDQGVNLSIDCFGQRWNLELSDFVTENDWQRLAGLVKLIKEGYSSQLTLGTDTFLKILTRRGGGEGYCHITRFVLPTLRRLEVSEYDIFQMTVQMPARLLSIG